MSKPIEILLVEDNPAEVRLTREGLKEARIANTLNAVMDGQSAIEYLQRRGKYQNAVRPDLVLLDLNLPGLDGRSVLKHIKEDPQLKIIPVVIITSSEAESDIIKSYEAHANCFISKPIDFEGFTKVIRSIEHFWFTVVRLP
ncbi:MAG TPA: response regulator [Bauldia sp.]|nr:response regulator [Bauldia sp.]